MRPLTDEERADVERVIPGVWGVVRATYHGSFPGFDLEDIFQYTIEAVCRARTRWEPARGSWIGYALGRAHGATIDFLRAERPGTRDNPAPNPLSLDAYPGQEDGDSPIDRIDFHQDPDPHDHLLESALWDAIDHLPPKTAAIFRLFAEGDMNQREVADVVGVTESRVSQQLKAASEWLAPRVAELLQPIAA